MHYNIQITARLTNDLVERLDRIADEKMRTRGALMRTMILEQVRAEESKKRCESLKMCNLILQMFK